jgi:hypothetical protein
MEEYSAGLGYLLVMSLGVEGYVKRGRSDSLALKI